MFVQQLLTCNAKTHLVCPKNIIHYVWNYNSMREASSVCKFLFFFHYLLSVIYYDFNSASRDSQTEESYRGKVLLTLITPNCWAVVSKQENICCNEKILLLNYLLREREFLRLGNYWVRNLFFWGMWGS